MEANEEKEESASNLVAISKETQRKMVHEIQCPGCIQGCDPATCKKLDLREYADDWGTLFRCDSHRPATFVSGIGRIMLGLPRGFCRMGAQWEAFLGLSDRPPGAGFIRLWEKDKAPAFDVFNVPVWALEKDGYLYIRTYMPRVNWTVVDVIEDGSCKKICPNAIDVANFYDEMD